MARPSSVRTLTWETPERPTSAGLAPLGDQHLAFAAPGRGRRSRPARRRCADCGCCRHRRRRCRRARRPCRHGRCRGRSACRRAAPCGSAHSLRAPPRSRSPRPGRCPRPPASSARPCPPVRLGSWGRHGLRNHRLQARGRHRPAHAQPPRPAQQLHRADARGGRRRARQSRRRADPDPDRRRPRLLRRAGPERPRGGAGRGGRSRRVGRAALQSADPHAGRRCRCR